MQPSEAIDHGAGAAGFVCECGKLGCNATTELTIAAHLVVAKLLVFPAFPRLAGTGAWYLRRWLDRVLPDVRFGHGSTLVGPESPPREKPVHVLEGSHWPR